MEIKRDYYLNKLIQKQDNHLIKIITGLRRCGKTYLLFHLFKNYLLKNGIKEDNIIELAFDSFKNKKYRKPEIFLDYIYANINNKDHYFILLDEIQLLEDFEAVLNELLHLDNVDIYITGSNAHLLSNDIVTEFRGRGDQIHLNPLSFKEFFSIYKGNKNDGWNEYLLYGGLPQVVLLKTPEEKVELLDNLINETYISDLKGRHPIQNITLFESLLCNAPCQVNFKNNLTVGKKGVFDPYHLTTFFSNIIIHG